LIGCDKIEVMISALIDNELEAEEETRVQKHLAICENCQATKAGFEAVDYLLRLLWDYTSPHIMN